MIDNFMNTGINRIASTPLNSPATKTINNDSPSFMDYLKDALNSVNEMQIQATRSSELFMAGLTDNIHQVMIDSEKAELALQFTLQIRNKILDAYNEIMRMQI